MAGLVPATCALAFVRGWTGRLRQAPGHDGTVRVSLKSVLKNS
jgi:hypothetical protein